MPLQVQAPFQINAGEPMDVVEDELDAGQSTTGHQVYHASLDLEQHLACYQGLARIHRLLYVADHCPPLRQDALVMALTFVRDQTFNISTYNLIHQRLQQDAAAANNINSSIPNGGPDVSTGIKRLPAYDAVWTEQTAKKAALKLEKLDTDLKHYKSNSIKESIRRGQDDLGEHYLDMGDLSNALKCFSRARDYCTTNKQIIMMCFNVIKVSAFLSNWPLVLSYVSRAENTADLSQPGASKDSTATRNQSLSKLKCAAGLAELAAKKYKVAARNFLQASFDHLNYPELISPNDVAKYGALCALASFDRQELQRNVISNTGFKQFLEVEPQLNDILIKFYESKYASCLRLLDEIRDNLLLDMYLAPHVNTLYSMIRNRGLIQYFSPYLSADMRKMAAAFNTTVQELEEELMLLILDGQIKGRIDSHNKILHAKDTDLRSSAFESVLKLGDDYKQRTKGLVIRAAIHKAGICVKSPPRGGTENHAGDVLTPTHSSNPSPTPNN